MTTQRNVLRQVEDIAQRDGRYKPDAYIFVLNALNFTIERLQRQGHITGAELLEGIRLYAIEQFGRMARTVFAHWGIAKTDDFGAMVFVMVEAGLLGKTERDSPGDFSDVYDFKYVFEDSYVY